MSQALVRVPLPRWLFATLLLVPMAFLLTGCGGSETGPVTAQSSRYEVAEEGPSTARQARPDQDAPQEGATVRMTDLAPSAGAPRADTATELPGTLGHPPAPPSFDMAASLDVSDLPDDPDELVDMLEALRVREPRGRNDQEQYEDYLRIQQARIQIAEHLRAVATEPDERVAAVQTKLDAMRALTMLGVPQMDKQLTAYSRSLQEGEDDESAFLGRLMLFGLAIDDLAGGEDVNVEGLLDELKALAEDGQQNAGVFMVISQAAGILQSLGERDAAVEAFRAIGETYRSSEDPQMAAEARAMFERIRIIEAGLDQKLRALLMGEPDSEAPALATISDLLAADDADVGTLAEMAQAAQFMEMTDRYEMADQIYEKIETAYQDHADSELAAQAVQQARNGLKRVGLIGNPLTVEGLTLDGQPFDWTPYEGKVVLIDFWATWCQPCLMEMPHIASVYRQYQDRGFEVVGISLDEDPKVVQRFMDVQPLPWTIVVGADEQSQGVENPVAVRAGVDTLPFLVLVGRDGNVAALHARGSRLQQKLEELLGAPNGAAPGPSPVAPLSVEPSAPPATDAPAPPAAIDLPLQSPR